MTPHAKAAAAIRKEIKALFPGVKFTCTSESFSMGNAVRVATEGLAQEVAEKIRALLQKYQYGNFNGMTDCYEYSNSRKDVPQVKFVQYSNY